MRPKQAQAVEDDDNRAAFVIYHAACAVFGRLCVPQAATDDQDIGYHHRRNGEYD